MKPTLLGEFQLQNYSRPCSVGAQGFCAFYPEQVFCSLHMSMSYSLYYVCKKVTNFKTYSRRAKLLISHWPSQATFFYFGQNYWKMIGSQVGRQRKN